MLQANTLILKKGINPNILAVWGVSLNLIAHIFHRRKKERKIGELYGAYFYQSGAKVGRQGGNKE
jgi:hypothetical protein